MRNAHGGRGGHGRRRASPLRCLSEQHDRTQGPRLDSTPVRGYGARTQWRAYTTRAARTVLRARGMPLHAMCVARIRTKDASGSHLAAASSCTHELRCNLTHNLRMDGEQGVRGAGIVCVRPGCAALTPAKHLVRRRSLRSQCEDEGRTREPPRRRAAGPNRVATLTHSLRVDGEQGVRGLGIARARPGCAALAWATYLVRPLQLAYPGEEKTPSGFA
jgi:hypothetical protein